MRRRVARLFLDAGLLVIVVVLSRVHARYIGHYSITKSVPGRVAWTLFFVGLLATAAYAAGLPDLRRGARRSAVAAVVAPIAAAVVMSIVQAASGDALLPRFVVFGSAALAIPLGLAAAAIAGVTGGSDETRVLAVVSADEGAALAEEIARGPERAVALVGVIASSDVAAGEGARGKPVVDAALANRAELIVLGREALVEHATVSEVAALHEAGLRVRTLHDFYEQWLGKLPLSELEPTSLLFDINELHGRGYTPLKRMLDVAVAFAGLVALAVVLPFVVIGNLVGNRGPLVFRQERVGKDGRSFRIIKLRTMRPGSPATAWTTDGDPRITRFGRVLRRLHVDELPQVLNVLRGDLSLVGPRPEQPAYVVELSAKLPFYGKRHLVRPGITGWAQVKYGYGSTEQDALEKLQYEFFYLRNQSLGLDLRIIGRTLRTIVGGQGR